MELTPPNTPLPPQLASTYLEALWRRRRGRTAGSRYPPSRTAAGGLTPTWQPLGGRPEVHWLLFAM